ncbi:phosphoribosyltransferase family protein [Bacillus velezensis]|uniref:phosphoribosyltransferase family protein n=1 Tax=Bacillus velezensis TaxID=492670 RepID=UPI0021768E2B|nr:double zinc ribbon domain-containing protein [Bacillus velezensis]
MNCLLCDSPISSSLTWRSLFSLAPEQEICSICSSQFEKIEGPVCSICGRPQESNEKCADCAARESKTEKRFLLRQNRSVFLYNDAMKDSLARFKFRGDAKIIQAFERDFAAGFKAAYPSNTHTLIPIPLSGERLAERGFNQSELLASLLGMPVISPLIRLNNEKQSKKSKTDRLSAEKKFSAAENSAEGMNVILIDDIYTTGATLHQAAEVLLTVGKASSVSSFTLIRS